MINSIINFFLKLFRINRKRHFFSFYGPLSEATIRTAIRLATLDGSELYDIKINYVQYRGIISNDTNDTHIVICTKKKGESK